MIHEMILNLVVPCSQHEGFFMRGNCAAIARQLRGNCAGSVLKEKSKIFMYGIGFERKIKNFHVLDQFCKVFDQENLYGIGFVRYSTRKIYTGSVLCPNFYTGSVLCPNFYTGSVLRPTQSPDFQASAHQSSLDFQASAHQGSKHKKAMI